MKKNEILKAWRDAEYYASLTPEEQAAVPANPAALPEVADDVLGSITGGCGGATSAICSPCPPKYCY